MRVILLAIFSFYLYANITDAKAVDVSDDILEKKQKIIQKAIDSYHGRCPCPYMKAKNGSKCGRRSAYSKGSFFLCFPQDVTDKMLKSMNNKN